MSYSSLSSSGLPCPCPRLFCPFQGRGHEDGIGLWTTRFQPLGGLTHLALALISPDPGITLSTAHLLLNGPSHPTRLHPRFCSSPPCPALGFPVSGMPPPQTPQLACTQRWNPSLSSASTEHLSSCTLSELAGRWASHQLQELPCPRCPPHIPPEVGGSAFTNANPIIFPHLELWMVSTA